MVRFSGEYVEVSRLKQDHDNRTMYMSLLENITRVKKLTQRSPQKKSPAKDTGLDQGSKELNTKNNYHLLQNTFSRQKNQQFVQRSEKNIKSYDTDSLKSSQQSVVNNTRGLQYEFNRKIDNARNDPQVVSKLN